MRRLVEGEDDAAGDVLGLQGHPPLVSTIRERLPTTALVLQTDRSDSTAAVTALLDRIEEDEDVQAVYHTMK